MSDERDQLLNISLKLAKARMALAKAERRLEKSRAKWRTISAYRGVRLVMKAHRLWARLRAKARTLLAGGKAEDPMSAEFNRLLDIARKLPKSNGSRFYVKRNVRIGIVCDHFMWDAIHPAADFVYIRPTRKGLAALDTVDLFLVCSTWEGLHRREWRNCRKAGTESNRLLLLMMDRSRARGKKVAFYSKEDPVHYAKFLNVARHADVIFTSATEMIPSYRRDCGHDRVYPLVFCINPELHNPIGSCGRNRRKGALFAGSWRSNYRQRCEDQRMMFDGVLVAGLQLRIVNRYDFREEPKYAFPEVYRPFEWSPVAHDDLMALHKLFDWAVNINTVTTSETMSANRICELLASGNLLLSNFSKAMPERYPEAVVIRKPTDVRGILRTKTVRDLEELKAAGVRRMMTGETCHDRVDEILGKMGLPQTPRSRRVLVVCRQRTAAVVRAFAKQTYPARELMSIDEVTPEVYGRFDMVMWFSADGIYDKFRLEDLSNAFKYANVDFVTMGADRPHDYVPAFKDRYNTLFWRESLPLERLQDPETVTFSAGGYCVSCADLPVLDGVRRYPRLKICYADIPNMGDQLNPLIIGRIFGYDVVPASEKHANLMAIGSGLRLLSRKRTGKSPLCVWGTGFLSRREIRLADGLEVDCRAVRGELSRKRLEGLLGRTLDIPTADPGLLASLLLDRPVEKRYDLGVIAHCRERDDPRVLELARLTERTLVIDVSRNPMRVIKQIASCRRILSSSLHGLVIADSLGVPNLHVKISDKPLGDGFKFEDYYSAFGLHHDFVDLRTENIDSVESIDARYRISSEAVRRKQRELLDAFPYRKREVCRPIPTWMALFAFLAPVGALRHLAYRRCRLRVDYRGRKDAGFAERMRFFMWDLRPFGLLAMRRKMVFDESLADILTGSAFLRTLAVDAMQI